MKTVSLSVALVLLAIWSMTIQSLHGQTAPSKSLQLVYEYKVIDIPGPGERFDRLSTELNDLGKDGWEVVTTYVYRQVPDSTTIAGETENMGPGFERNQAQLILKRRKV